MANSDHLEILCQGPKVWNAWRDENPQIIPDLSKVNVALCERQFGPSEGGPINLRAVNLEGANLRFTTLTEADLEGARLVGADLLHAKLDRAKLIATDLTDAMLDHADLTDARFERTVVIGTSFLNARNLTQAQLDGAFGDATTKLPDALTPPESWFPQTEPEGDEPFLGYNAREAEFEEEQDLYDILGVSDTVSQKEIRTAYRALVKKLHPDLNPNDRVAQDKFKLVSMAYKVLGDPEKRARYDRDEIDGEGRVRPEYEARQQFRKYAFRYYAAAALSLMLAIGVLVAVWYLVLISERPTVVKAPETNNTANVSKHAERLGDASPFRMMPSGPLKAPTAKAPTPVAEAGATTAEKPAATEKAVQQADLNTPTALPASKAPPGKADTGPSANAEEPPAVASGKIADIKKEATRPLWQEHKKAETGAPQSDPVQTLTSAQTHSRSEETQAQTANKKKAGKKTSRTDKAEIQQEGASGALQPFKAVHAVFFMPQSGARDDNSLLFGSRAIVQVQTEGAVSEAPQITGSIATLSFIAPSSEFPEHTGRHSAHSGSNLRSVVHLGIKARKQPLLSEDTSFTDNPMEDERAVSPPWRSALSTFTDGL